MEATGIVGGISSKEVEVKKGPRAGKTSTTYSFIMDDIWYNMGFKELCNKGDSVTVDYLAGVYGNQVNNVTVHSKGTAPMSGAAPALTSTSKSGYRKNGEAGGFPIHPRAYERALDRRNALTNAVRFHTHQLETGMVSDVSSIIETARQFEAYTCGDIEMEMLEKLKIEGETK